ncbi:hypothetical protein D8674_024961 [Pyrus ussuriensis x Pyrus communis]|uniref:Uncharacterized protein n=1 Tax=Pyrus ussuriensis x Pyrus communis TaxID=2448454 RepID=A0A5N5H4D0_9ROSA|nr:hypothetical protein D8674_024961 [Pyrus ussuriensis x Pyrus communis]
MWRRRCMWRIGVGILAAKVFDQASEFFASRFSSEHESVPSGNSREDSCSDNCMKECEEDADKIVDADWINNVGKLYLEEVYGNGEVGKENSEFLEQRSALGEMSSSEKQVPVDSGRKRCCGG